jgi:hypothetical protein
MKIVLRFYKFNFSDKYSKVYRDSSQKKQFYYFFVRCPNYFSCFFIQLSLSIFGYADKTDGILYIQIFTS